MNPSDARIKRVGQAGSINAAANQLSTVQSKVAVSGAPMSDRVYKLIELIGSSSASIDDAVHCPSTFDRALTPSDHTREIPPLTNDRAPR